MEGRASARPFPARNIRGCSLKEKSLDMRKHVPPKRNFAQLPPPFVVQITGTEGDAA